MAIKTSYWPLSGSEKNYFDNKILFESDVPGNYTFIPKYNCVCEITVIGAGAGGAYNSSSNRSSTAPGSSGSGCIVRCELKKGITYNLVVGKSGNPSGGVDWDTWGGAGGASKISINDQDLITAPGGNGGHVWWPNGSKAATPPNFCTISNILEPQVKLNKKGNTGGIGTGNGGSSVIDGTTHGKGGSATNAGGSSTAKSGENGYIKIVAKMWKKKYKKYVFSKWTQPILTSNGTVGGNSYACEDDGHYASQYAYLAFDGNNNTNWNAINGTMPHWLTFYSPVFLRLQNIKIITADNADRILAGDILASNNNEAWTKLASFEGLTDTSKNLIEVPINTNSIYKYIRVKLTKVNGGWGWIWNEEITAEYVSGNIDSTESDYDYISYE